MHKYTYLYSSLVLFDTQMDTFMAGVGLGGGASGARGGASVTQTPAPVSSARPEAANNASGGGGGTPKKVCDCLM